VAQKCSCFQKTGSEDEEIWSGRQELPGSLSDYFTAMAAPAIEVAVEEELWTHPSVRSAGMPERFADLRQNLPLLNDL
jgi:hypothetical protein